MLSTWTMSPQQIARVDCALNLVLHAQDAHAHAVAALSGGRS
jgi:hypothetical protein